MRRRATIGCGALVAAGSMLAAVVMVGASDGGRGAAPDADRSPATLDEVRARTVAAPQARYAVEVHVEVAPHQILEVEERGAYDRSTGHAWVETAMADPSRAPDGAAFQILERLRITPTGMYLQPVHVAASLGLLPTQWLGTPVDATAPPPAEVLARSLGGLAGDLGSPAAASDDRGVGTVGRERLHGVPTRHLRVTTGAARDGAADRADLWIDRRGRVRRLVVVRGPVTVRLDVLAYGRPVTVDLPDGDQVSGANAVALRTVLASFGDPGPT